jgi:agmatinase
MTITNKEPQEGWFSPAHTFGGLPPEWTCPDKSKIVLLPVPYETSTTYRGGCRNGPAAIIEASVNMELYDEDLKCEPCRIGVHTLPPLDVLDDAEKTIARVDEVATTFIERDKFVTLLGGEHTVSLGMVRALRRRYTPLSVLYLDAHADFRKSYRGNAYSHACVARRMCEMCRVVMAGVRSLSKEEAAELKEKDIPMAWASDFRRARNGGGCRELIGRLLDRLGENVYVSIDVDVFDPSLMPAVGTPEPGGLLWDEVIELLQAVVATKKLVGLDMVELAPIDGVVHPQFTAARLLQKIWGYAFSA